MKIIGSQCFGHDGSICLLEDGEIVYWNKEERLSRRKRDRVPWRVFEEMKANFDLSDLDTFVRIAGDPISRSRSRRAGWFEAEPGHAILQEPSACGMIWTSHAPGVQLVFVGPCREEKGDVHTTAGNQTLYPIPVPQPSATSAPGRAVERGAVKAEQWHLKLTNRGWWTSEASPYVTRYASSTPDRRSSGKRMPNVADRAATSWSSFRATVKASMVRKSW